MGESDSVKRTKRKTPRPGKLFPFTRRDEARMKEAMEEARKFMEGYGKGVRPHMIDLSHYENSAPDNKQSN